MQRILFLIRKEFKQVFRDRPMIAIIFIVPIIQLFILSFAITTEVKHLKLFVVDLDNSRESREIANAFSRTEQFDLIGVGRDQGIVRQGMKSWDIQVALIIPAHFSRDLERRLRPQIGIILDGVDGNTAGVAMGYAQKIMQDFGADLLTQPRYVQALRRIHLATMEERMWYNMDLSSQQFMVPGIVVVLLTIIPMMLTGMSLVREKEIGTLEQLMVTPLKKHQLLMGKIIPFLILSYFELGIVMAVAVTYFKIVMNGSYFLLAALSLIYLFATLGLGIFVSTITNSQQQAMFVAWFFMVFMILLSGFFIPIPNMPVILQKITYLNPMRYIMSIVRDIFQKGSTIRYLWIDVIPLAIFSLIIFFFSVIKFQKRVG